MNPRPDLNRLNGDNEHDESGGLAEKTNGSSTPIDITEIPPPTSEIPSKTLRKYANARLGTEVKDLRIAVFIAIGGIVVFSIGGFVAGIYLGREISENKVIDKTNLELKEKNKKSADEIVAEVKKTIAECSKKPSNAERWDCLEIPLREVAQIKTDGILESLRLRYLDDNLKFCNNLHKDNDAKKWRCMISFGNTKLLRKRRKKGKR